MLDYETERKVCDSLLDNLNDQTVFFTGSPRSAGRSHRDVASGAVVEVGTTTSYANGRYYALYRQQDGN